MDIRQLLIEKRNELVDKNNEYNENLTLLRNLQNEVEVLESTKEERINKVRKLYWIICFILIILQNLINLGGFQHILAWIGITINAGFLYKRTGKIRKEIADKRLEAVNLEISNGELFELVFKLRSEVHDLANQVEKMPILELEEEYREVISEVQDFQIGECSETPVMKMLSLY